MPKKVRFKNIPPGNNDMGGDLTGLGDVEELCKLEAYYDSDGLTSFEADFLIEDPLEAFLVDSEASMSPYYWLLGSEVQEREYSPKAIHYQNPKEFCNEWFLSRNDDESADVVEICGGMARTSKILIKRSHRFRVGLNFDAVVGFDFLNPRDRAYLWKYLKAARPLVVILATPCAGLSGFSALNASKGSATHFANEKIFLILGQLGAEIAAWQLQNNRHYLAENLRGSRLFNMPSWKRFENDPRTASADMEMCAAGMRDFDNPKLFIHKTTTLKASCGKLFAPLRKFKCDGGHQHQPIEGKCSDGESRSHRCRIWPLRLAEP